MCHRCGPEKQKKEMDILFYFLIFFLSFLGPHPQHMEVPRLGVESELQLPAYTTATAMPDPSLVFDLCQILDPLSEARD